MGGLDHSRGQNSQSAFACDVWTWFQRRTHPSCVSKFNQVIWRWAAINNL